MRAIDIITHYDKLIDELSGIDISPKTIHRAKENLSNFKILSLFVLTFRIIISYSFLHSSKV